MQMKFCVMAARIVFLRLQFVMDRMTARIRKTNLTAQVCYTYMSCVMRKCALKPDIRRHPSALGCIYWVF